MNETFYQIFKIKLILSLVYYLTILSINVNKDLCRHLKLNVLTLMHRTFQSEIMSHKFTSQFNIQGLHEISRNQRIIWNLPFYFSIYFKDKHDKYIHTNTQVSFFSHLHEYSCQHTSPQESCFYVFLTLVLYVYIWGQLRHASFGLKRLRRQTNAVI